MKKVLGMCLLAFVLLFSGCTNQPENVTKESSIEDADATYQNDETTSVSHFVNNQEFYDGLYWGMSMQQIERAEEYSGTETNGTYIVQEKNFLGYNCNVLYDFDIKDKLIAVSFMPTSRKYQDYFDMFFLLYHEYGIPYYAKENLSSDSSSALPSQVIKWIENDTEILFGYMGESDFSACNITIIFQEKNSDESEKNSNVTFINGNRQCSSGKAVGGCNNSALPWSRNCKEHNCNIVGCDGYPWSKLNDIPLCATHYMSVLDGIIYVGYIDSDTKQRIEDIYGINIK